MMRLACGRPFPSIGYFFSWEQLILYQAAASHSILLSFGCITQGSNTRQQSWGRQLVRLRCSSDDRF